MQAERTSEDRALAWGRDAVGISSPPFVVCGSPRRAGAGLKK